MINKTLRRTGALLALALCSLHVQAQTEFEVQRPGIHAQQFLSAASPEASLHTGQLSVNIPLLTLPGKGVDIPVTLAFSTADVNHETEASSVGLGWSLLAGGVITSVINGSDDLTATTRSAVPWQYNANYITSKFSEQQSSGYSIMDSALQGMNTTGNPDTYYYSFMGHSGEIDFSLDQNNNRVNKLYPDTDFRLAKTQGGYTITDTDGVVYRFEEKGTCAKNGSSVTNSWFLSQITTPQGGVVNFSYEEEHYPDLRIEVDGQYYRNHIYTCRLTRIESDYGYILFNSESRDDIPNTKRIKSIELYNKTGTLQKGYTLTDGVYFTNTNTASTSHYNRRMGLSAIQEYGKDGTTLPATRFTYGYSFSRSKNTYKPHVATGANHARGSWARLPGWLTVVDRNTSGNPACWVSGPANSSTLHGYSTVEDYCDQTVEDYFCLTRIDYPSGGYESFTYEDHDYSRVGTSTVDVTPGSEITGRRLKSRTIADNLGNLQYVEYVYKRHSADYSVATNAKSSGILVHPSIHTTVMYRVVVDNLNNHSRFEAVPYYTDKPQNSFEGVPVCYTEVEEVRKNASGGVLCRDIHYFDRVVAEPGLNYIYTNYDFVNGSNNGLLVTLQNTWYGLQGGYPSGLEGFNTTYTTYLNYPMGPSYRSTRTVGKLRRRITLDNYNRVVRTELNDYNHHETAVRYGYTVCMFNDGVKSSGATKYRYLINRSTRSIVYSRLNKRTVTDYTMQGSAVADSVRTVNQYGYSGNRLTLDQLTTDNGTVVRKEYVYPDGVAFDTSSGLSAQATALKKLVEKNMTGTPVQTVEKRDGAYTGGTFRTHKLSGSYAVADSVFTLKTGASAGSVTTRVNSSGKLVRHANFEFDRQYTHYDSALNPLAYLSRTDLNTTVWWGHGGRCIMAVLGNYVYSQLQASTTLQTRLQALESYKVVSASNYADVKTAHENVRKGLLSGMSAVTYTWDPDNGITSAAGEDGIVTFYEYDAHHRLKAVRDADWKTIESYTYHYKE
ncbi:MAG: hypothetical protein IKB31_09445 [Bacteroidaceae bacterium]|nr:hypothetical protein [Bacteroidaceae bacterium]